MDAARRAAALALVVSPALLTACAEDAPVPRTEEPDYVLLLDDDAEPDQMLGEPGRYAMTARGEAPAPLAVLDVPAGYSNFGFFALWPEGSADVTSSAGRPFRAVQYWTVHGVHRDPCDRSGPAPAVGDSVDDLAAALAAQELTSATPAEPVTLDGHDGVYLELTVSPTVRIQRCQEGYFVLWEGTRDDQHHVTDSPGTVERLWILDVDGQRVVLDAMAAPGVSDAQADELTTMVSSARFTTPQGKATG